MHLQTEYIIIKNYQLLLGVNAFKPNQKSVFSTVLYLATYISVS